LQQFWEREPDFYINPQHNYAQKELDLYLELKNSFFTNTCYFSKNTAAKRHFRQKIGGYLLSSNLFFARIFCEIAKRN
jgi:hypothetical protein